MTIWTTLIAVPLFLRGHRRAAVFTVGVMLSTSLLTTGIKLLYGRSRPTWQDPAGKLISKSFPSGHASSSAALAGVLIVIAAMLVRKAVLRRAVYAGAVLLALVVGLDRVLLGRHYPTDVIGGWLLGAWWSWCGCPLQPTAAQQAWLRNHWPRSPPTTTGRDPEPAKLEDVGRFRSIVSAMAEEAGWSHPAGLPDRRGPAPGGERRRRARTWCRGGGDGTA
jgi:hypothetical protein